jgi:16S rRNA (uracil1498-N3)-methyltransferase
VSGARFSVSDQLPLTITLPAEQSHHISHVLRLKIGDPIEIGDGQSELIGLATVTQLGAQVSACITSYIQERTNGHRPISLLLALCKGDKNELIIDWATELGCEAIHLWQSPRSVMRLKDQRDSQHKLERYTKIAQAAAQQSRQAKPATITLSTSIKDALAKLNQDTPGRLLCSLASEATPIQLKLATLSDNSPIIIAVGPEGDLDPNEELLLTTEHNFSLVSLGRATLRSELAVVSAIAAIRQSSFSPAAQNAESSD